MCIQTSIRALAVAIGICAVSSQAQAQAPARFGFDVDIVLSPRAAERLRATKEGITVDASYSGDPKPGAEKQANEIGSISLGVERILRPGQAGRVHVSGETIESGRLAWIQGEVRVNVNVYSSRRHGGDNILNCDFIDAEVAKVVAAQPIHLRCALITEHADTALKP